MNSELVFCHLQPEEPRAIEADPTSLRPSCLYFLLKTLSTSSLFLQTPHVSKAKEKASLLTFFLFWRAGLRCCPGLSPAVARGCSGCGAQWLRGLQHAESPWVRDRTGSSIHQDLPVVHFNNPACSSGPSNIPCASHLYLLPCACVGHSLKPAALLTDKLGAGRALEH